ncbi:MAG: DUF4440 domain-containing protein [Pyrinomonadaceae bacterium]
MKKIFAFVSLVIFALACAAPPTNESALSTNRNANTAPPATIAITEADAIAKEKAVWEAIRLKDYEAFGNMLASDQLEVLDVGVHDKAASIAGVKEFEPSEVVFSDWKHLPINRNAFVVSYTVNMKGKYKGKEFAPQSVRGSSAWVNREGKWLAIFHQECPVKPPMTPSPTPRNPTTPVASPSPAPVTATTGPDPIANEKLVWDLFKTRNYDAFAALLAPEFLEIEPDNVYDKAGSVKGVTMFDASKSVLSDFKTANLDPDAALVTYVAKTPGFSPEGERHSSIWVKRDGKWLGLFHHGGTPIVKMPATPAASASPVMK